MTKSTASVVGDFLEKSQHGEGSRGGKIIGHTKSGKPVYAATSSSHSYIKRGPDHGYNSSNHTAHTRLTVATHPGWSSKDHQDAGLLHQREEARLSGLGQDKEALHSSNAMIAHFTASGEIKRHPELRPSVKKSQHGEGTRGGHIIGHTRSGKAIYAADGHHYHGLYEGVESAKDIDSKAIGRTLRNRYKGFTSAEHTEAAAAHAYNSRTTKRGMADASMHLGAAMAHEYAAKRNPRPFTDPLKTPESWNLHSTQKAAASGKRNGLKEALAHNAKVVSPHFEGATKLSHQKLADWHDQKKEKLRSKQERGDTSYATQKLWDHHNTMASTHAHLANEKKD